MYAQNDFQAGSYPGTARLYCRDTMYIRIFKLLSEPPKIPLCTNMQTMPDGNQHHRLQPVRVRYDAQTPPDIEPGGV